MPRIPDELLKATFFLYPTEADARAGSDAGGTGFFVSVPIYGNKVAAYAVTNYHVVKGGAPVIRLNRKDGGVEIFDYAPEDYTFDPAIGDIAVVPLSPNPEILDVKFVPSSVFATEEAIQQKDIGLGEDIVMVGRFVDHGGKEVNEPTARFGNISAMPSPMQLGQLPGQPTTDNYLLDVHSRTGYSGSPVYVYRTPGSNFKAGATINFGDQFIFLLGIHFGQFPEFWELKDGRTNSQGQFVKGMSGMTAAAPASDILKLLDTDDLRDRREQERRTAELADFTNLGLQVEIAGDDGDGAQKVVPNTPPSNKKD